MMIRLFVLLVVCSACGSGKIACPHIRPDKVRASSVRHANLKRETPRSSLIEEKEEVKKKKVVFKRHTGNVKKAESLEEWDCPRPGATARNRKIAKKMEKKYRVDNSKRKQPQDSTGYVLPIAR